MNYKKTKIASLFVLFSVFASAEMKAIVKMHDSPLSPPKYIIDPDNGSNPDPDNPLTTILTHISTGSGDNFTYGIDEFGYVWGVGDNTYDQLSVDYGSTVSRWSKIPLPSGKKVKEVSSGRYHSYILDTDGDVWGIGDNQYGQLGVGHRNKINYYTAASGLTSKIIKLSGGFNHAYGLDVDGNIWATGHGYYGQIGNGSTSNRSSWVKATSGTKFVDVQGTVLGGFAIDESGNLWYTGENAWYQGGMGSNAQTNTWTMINSSVFNGAKIVKASGGWHHSIVLDDQGNVWGAGADDDDNTQIGLLGGQYSGQCTTLARNYNCAKTWIKLNVNNESAKMALATPYNTHVVTNSNTLWGTGNNYSGELGIGSSTKYIPNFTKTNMENVHSIYPNQGFTHVFDKDGELWVAGSTRSGVLGNVSGDTKSFVKPDISELIVEE